MAILSAYSMANAFGILGNIVSFLLFLAPVPTFYRIYKKKSTEGFQSIPYSVALFTVMLFLYYGFLKTDGLLIITINSIGCAIEATYLILFMIYATKEAKIYTMKLIMLFNTGAYGLILLSTFLLSKGPLRISIVGWICSVFSVCTFAAPLSIMVQVIKTKSVEYMPFVLSFFLALCAVTWFFYGFFIEDFYIATPNILGFAFGVAQMVLYLIYNKKEQALPTEQKQKKQALPNQVNLEDSVKVVELSSVILEDEDANADEDEIGNKPIKPSESNV